MKTFELLVVVLLVHSGRCQILDDLSIYDESLADIWNKYTKQHTKCFASDDPKTEGTCMHSTECYLKQGESKSGNCGFLKTCCVHNKRCGQRSKQRISYFENPNNLPEVCLFTVSLINDNICQVRLDYEKFSMGAAVSFACTEYMSVSPDVAGVPNLCGENTGQHLYIPVKDHKGDVVLTVHTKTSSNAQWKIKVTQLECPGSRKYYNHNFIDYVAKDAEMIAPSGCAQYYTNLSGKITNFGFQAETNTNYLSNQNYAICFKRPNPRSKISFTLNFLELGSKGNGLDENCDHDYIFIPELMISQKQSIAKVCDSSNEKIESHTPGPLYIIIHSAKTGQINEKGFEISYEIKSS